MIFEWVRGDDQAGLAAVLIRGDLDINEVKLPKALSVLHAKLVSEERILRKVSGTVPDSWDLSVFNHSKENHLAYI